MSNYRRRLSLLALAAWLALAAVGSARAEPAAQGRVDRPLGLVDVYSYGPKQERYLAAYNADGTERGRIAMTDQNQQTIMSGNGQWLAESGYDQATQAQALDYRFVNGRPTPIPVDKGFNVLPPQFSTDSRYLMYLMYAYEPTQQYVLGVMEMVTGKKIEFAGNVTINGGDPEATFPGAPSPIDFNGQRLLFFGIPIGTEGYPQGIYSIDVPALSGGRVPLPPIKILRRGDPPLQATSLSPDGTKLAYMFNDPANPPANYKPQEMTFTLNSLGIIDLNTGSDRVVARAGQGQALEAMAWWFTSDFVIFTGGNFQQTSRVVSPRFYSVSAATGQVTNTAPITFSSNPMESVLDLMACNTALFYVTQIGDGNDRVETLYTSPLNFPRNAKKLLSGTLMHVQLQRCIPAFAQG